MNWQDLLKGDSLAWLLEEENPGVHYLALRDLTGTPHDSPEYLDAQKAAHNAGPIAQILAQMNPAGYWEQPGPGYNPKYRSSVWSVILLAQLGADASRDARLQTACAYLLEHALAQGGQISASGAPSGTADCLQGNLCWALAALGFRDPRLGQAFEWLARSTTGEGVASQEDRQAPLRYYAGKCGPNFACGSNNKLACAWGAVKVVLALSQCPGEYRTRLWDEALQRGVDFLFSVDPLTAAYPSGFTGKPSQSWFKFGFPVFYVTDVLQVLEALAACGYGKDARLANALEWVRSKQDERGRWPLEYDYAGKTWVDFGVKKQANKWVTLRALRVLKACV